MHSQIESSALEAFRPVGLQTKVKSWQWDVAKAHLLNSLRETPFSTYHDIDLMSGGSSARARLPSADSINPGINSEAHHETVASPRSTRASSAPTSGTPNIGEERIVRVFSDTIMDFVEEPAMFVDRQENWISKGLVERLGLTPRPDGNTSAKFNNLDGKLFKFKGTVIISCCWKDPPLHRHPVPVTCHIVPSAMSHIMLKASFCATPDPPSKLAAPLEVAPSISSTSLLSGQFPSESSHPASTAAKTTPAILTRSIASDETLVSDLNGSGIIDSFIGEFYTENSNGSNWADSYMDKVQKCMGPKNIDKEHTRTMPKVKVAILDTGIAHDHPTIKGLKTKKSFSESDHWHKSFVVDGHPDKTSTKATQDTNGHGTHIAALFARVAPRAQIYIAKIAESTVIPTDNRIAEAIEWAIKKKVDIISMSFGLTAPQSGIQHAIKTAAANNILMFAAASNQGQGHEPTFPASDSSVMCIYAADGNGNKSKTNPQTIAGKSRFSTVGIALKSAWLEQPENPDIIEARKSGTSYATPIAAGIAACILEFALQQVMEDEKYNQLKTLGKMNRVFNLMKTKSDRPDLLDFIVPWELFHETFRRTTILDLILRELG